MEKVKLTQEQADYISSISLNSLYRWVYLDRNKNTDMYKSLKNLSIEDIAKAKIIGYEVEQEVKVGDFVDIGLFGISKVAEVTGVKGKLIAINGSDEYHEFKINRVLTDEEKQEEKQRRWWKSHNRDVWELRQGDVVTINDEIWEVNYFGCDIHFVNGESGDWLNETEFETIKHDIEVICFAEDRKDIK